MGHGGDVFTERSTQRSVVPSCQILTVLLDNNHRYLISFILNSYLVTGSYEPFQTYSTMLLETPLVYSKLVELIRPVVYLVHGN